MCERCGCSLPNLELDQPASRGPVGWVRRPGIWAGVPGGQRGCDSAWEMHKRACACEPGESHMCACSSDLLSLLGAVHTSVSCEPCMWVLLKTAPCLWQPV